MRILNTLAALVLAAGAVAALAAPAAACDSCSAPEAIETASYLYGGESDFFDVYADQGETMYVDLYGYDDWADLDVIVTDERGRTVASGTGDYADEVFQFVARRAGVYTVEVINLESGGCVEYDLSVI